MAVEAALVVRNAKTTRWCSSETNLPTDFVHVFLFDHNTRPARPERQLSASGFPRKKKTFTPPIDSGPIYELLCDSP